MASSKQISRRRGARILLPKGRIDWGQISVFNIYSSSVGGMLEYEI